MWNSHANVRYLVELKFCTSGSKMTKNLREKPQTLSFWILLECKILGGTDARFLVQVTQEWNQLSQDLQNWMLLHALEKVRIIVLFCLFFFLFYMKHKSMSHWYGYVKEKVNSLIKQRGSSTLPAGVCIMKRLGVLLLPQGCWSIPFHPPPHLSLREIAYIAALPSVKTSCKWRGGITRNIHYLMFPNVFHHRKWKIQPWVYTSFQWHYTSPSFLWTESWLCSFQRWNTSCVTQGNTWFIQAAGWFVTSYHIHKT